MEEPKFTLAEIKSVFSEISSGTIVPCDGRLFMIPHPVVCLSYDAVEAKLKARRGQGVKVYDLTAPENLETGPGLEKWYV